MNLFDEYIDEIIKIEGAYSDNKNDSGGETKYGITIAKAREFNYHGKMKDLPISVAKQIYRECFWNRLSLTAIEGICPIIVHELLDTGINQGVGRAGEYLQECLNSFNDQEAHYPDVKIDGEIGPATLSALRSFVQKRGNEGGKVLLSALNGLQIAYYIRLSQARKKDEDFVYGWIKNRGNIYG
jgi:lysozyme family protein